MGLLFSKGEERLLGGRIVPRLLASALVRRVSKTSWLFLVAVVAACATSASAPPAPAYPPATLPVILTSGISTRPDAPACSAEDIAFGPVSAGVFQGTGPHYACRIGPSPEEIFRKEVRENQPLASCLRSAGAGVVEATVVVEPDGRVSSIEISRLEGDSERLRACLTPIAHLRLRSFGCRWSQVYRWLSVE